MDTWEIPFKKSTDMPVFEIPVYRYEKYRRTQAKVAARNPPQRPLPRYEHAEQRATGSNSRRSLNVNDSSIRERFSLGGELLRRPQRRLQTLVELNFNDAGLQQNTYLRFTSRDGDVLVGSYLSQSISGIYAGVNITTVEVVLAAPESTGIRADDIRTGPPSTAIYWDVNGASLKIVDKDITTTGASGGECHQLAMGSDVVNLPWSEDGGAACIGNSGENSQVRIRLNNIEYY